MSIPRLDLDQAIAAMRSAIAPITDTETVATAAALNRINARDLSAPMNLPPFPSSAMDGYAYQADHCDPAKPLQIVGTSLAGHPYRGRLQRQQCIRITTGAVVPEHADTVVVQEDTQRDATQLRITLAPRSGDNIRQVGHDVLAAAPLLDAGEVLNAFRLSWLAACGIAELQVYRQPVVVVFSTGDELVSPGEPLAAGQIYDSNRLLVQSLLSTLPVSVIDGGRLADEPAAIRAAFAQHRNADCIITSGGVSVGDADFLTDIVAADGELNFWRLNLKPGKPLAFGRLGKPWYIGLPGNPVSSAVTFLLVAKPALWALAGGQPQMPTRSWARLSADIRHKPGREEYQRGYLSSHSAEDRVAPTGDQNSNRLSSFKKSNCLIRLAKHQGNLQTGQLVEIIPLFGLV